MGNYILDAEDISVSIGKRTILDHCFLKAGRGEFIGIIGPNGAGKSTFLKAVRGLIPRASGSVSFNGQPEKNLSEKDIARTIAFMQQDFRISFGYTCREIVLSARYPYLKWWQKEGPHDREVAEKWMNYTGVSHLADKPIQAVSGGEKQRVILAKVLAQETPLLFLDEPTAALDLLYQEQIFRLCRHLSDHGKTIIMICHDLMMAAQWCSRLLLLSQSHFIADGKPEDVLTEDNILKAFQLDALVYRDTITDRLSLYTYQRKEDNGKTILLLGSSIFSITVMRHLFLSGYRICWGPLLEESLAAEAARDFHIPHFPVLPEKFADPFAAVIDCSGDRPSPLPEEIPVYRGNDMNQEALLKRIDEGKL